MHNRIIGISHGSIGLKHDDDGEGKDDDDMDMDDFGTVSANVSEEVPEVLHLDDPLMSFMAPGGTNVKLSNTSVRVAPSLSSRTLH